MQPFERISMDGIQSIQSFQSELTFMHVSSLAHHPPLPPLIHPLLNLPKSMYNAKQLRTSSLIMASRDYLCRSNYMLGNLLPCSSHHFYHKYLHIVSKFQLECIETQQLCEIWPYMGSLIICPCVYNPIHSSANFSCSKVHFNINGRMYGSFGRPFLSMKSTSSSQCLTSVYEVWTGLGARIISLPFDTQRITTVNIVFGNLGRLLLAFLLTSWPKFSCWSLVASPSFLPHLPNLACTFLDKHLCPLPANSSSIIEINQLQPVLECLQKIFNRCHPVEGSISNVF